MNFSPGSSQSAGSPLVSSPGRRPKVLLYNPQAEFYTMPLSLLAIGSHLDPARYEVVIIDGRLEADPVKAVLSHLDQALCLGVSVLTGSPIRDAIRLSRAAKAYRPEVPVIWGGWHPSLFALECLEEESVDITVQGQGEATFTELLLRLEARESLTGCLGCAYRTGEGEKHLNDPRALADINTFQAHNYGLIPVARYLYLKGKNQLDYVTSQGCNFRCAFCAEPFFSKRRWSGLAPNRVGEEVEALWRTYHFDDLCFQDETFFTRLDRAQEIAEEFIRRRLPITWATTMRADQGDDLADGVMAVCKESGLRRVIIGVESGSQEMMHRIHKDINPEQVFRCAEKCQRHHLAAIFNFIVGFPHESQASLKASLEMARKLRAMSPAFQTPFFYFKPYPGSALTREAVKAGYLLPGSLMEWADFEFHAASGPWVTPEIHQLIERLNFYQQLALNQPEVWPRFWQRLAKWRCRNDFYALPVEKVLQDWLSSYKQYKQSKQRLPVE